jgi:hypothetical protein
MRSKVLLLLVTAMSILILALFAFSLVEWQSADIGNTKKGSTEIKGEEITIEANGADIWDAADACRYVYREVTGDFEMSARIVSLERANEWSKAGIMARQSIEANSQNTFINVTPDHGVKMIHRDAPGAATGPSPWVKNFEAPIWIKLVRKGDEFSSFWSEDGVKWDPADVESAEGPTPSVATIVMTDPILVGIAVTSHDSGLMTTAVVDKITGSPNLGLLVEPKGKRISTWAQVKK